MAYTRDWDENTPIDHKKFIDIPGETRKVKTDIAERLKEIIYGFISGETEQYKIKKLPLKELSSDPSNEANLGYLYTKDVSGKTELFYEDADGNVKQLTNGGKLNISDTEAVLLTGDQTIAGVKTFSDGIKTDTIDEETSDTGVTVDGCLIKDGKAADSDKLDGKDYNSTDIKPLGSWESKTFGTEYTASTDGFIVGSIYKTETDNTTGWCYVETPVGTVRMVAGGYMREYADTNVKIPFMCPVKKGDTWKVYLSGSSITGNYLYWIPLGV